MLILTFMLKTLIDVYIIVLLLRMWMQWTHCDFYNLFPQFILKITQPILSPLHRIIPAVGPLDSVSLLLAFILEMIKFPLLTFMETHVLMLHSLYLLISLLSLLKAAGTLVFWVVIFRSLLSLVSQGRSPMDVVLYQLSEPLLYPIRRILPPMGGIDVSAMIVILMLYALNYLGMNLFPGICYRL